MSFRLKLVAYFLLVSLLPLGAAAWGLHAVARRSETRKVDARLEAGLRAVVGSHQAESARVTNRANALASNSHFQRALQIRDREVLQRMLAGKHGIWLRSPVLTTGPAATMGRPTRVAVFTRPGKPLGTVIGGVPLTDRVHLSTLVRLRSGDSLVVLEDNRVVSGPRALAHVPVLLPLGPDTVRLAGSSYRALATPSQGQSSTKLAILSPQRGIDNAVGKADRRLMLGVLGSLILIALVAYVIGGSIVVSLGRLADAANAIARGRLHRRGGGGRRGGGVGAGGRRAGRSSRASGSRSTRWPISSRRGWTSWTPRGRGCAKRRSASATLSRPRTTSTSCC